MTGFCSDPDAIDQHAAQVRTIAQAVSTGAEAELAGIAQADFGVLIGSIIGPGILGIATMMQTSLTETAKGIDAVATGLSANATTYRDAESDTQQVITATGGGQ